MKKLRFVLFMMLLLGSLGCGNKEVGEPTTTDSYFVGMVTEIQDTYFLVEVTDKGNSSISVGSPVSISWESMEEELKFNILQGDSLKVTFNGEVMEKEPLSLGKVYEIRKEEIERQDYFDAKVLEVRENSLLVECTNCESGGIKEGSQVEVSRNTISSEAIPMVEPGESVRIVYIGGVLETYPLQLGDTLSIFLMDEKGEVITEPETASKVSEIGETIQESEFVCGINKNTEVIQESEEALELSRDEDENTKNDIPEACNEADWWGITMTAENVTPTGMTLVIFQSGGKPTGELQFGSDWFLKVWKDEAWEDVPYIIEEESVAWTQEAYMIPMGGSTSQEITWEYFHGTLPAGKYMLSKTFLDFRGTGDYDTQTFSVEFEIF